MVTLSYYTEHNSLAKAWNRDMTRLEWAKWVYHHPEQTEELLTKLVAVNDFENRILAIEQVDYNQEQKIAALQNALPSGEPEIKTITIDEIRQLLEGDGE